MDLRLLFVKLNDDILKMEFCRFWEKFAFFFSSYYSFSFTEISSKEAIFDVYSYIFQKRIKETLSVAAGEMLKIERLFDKDFYSIFAFYKLWNSEKGNDTNLRTKFGILWR